MSRRWQDAVIGEDLPLLQAVERLDEVALQILLVTDAHGRLVGTVTDGDVRRAILRGIDLHSPLAAAMHRDPVTIDPGASREAAVHIMRQRGVRQLPRVAPDGRVVGLELLEPLVQPVRDNWALVMAGGLGTRLRPLTDDTPKPLLRVGGRPLLETIVEALALHGFRRIFLSVNYRADQVESHFGDGSRFGVEIAYLREEEFLGTAGALSLLPEAPSEPMVVMNGDILTRVDFGQLLGFHERTGAGMSMCVREYEIEVPYGVVEVDGETVTSIVEKPTTRHFINAGIYVLTPELVRMIEPGVRLDMTDLAERALAAGHLVGAFPIHEYWLDIGHLEDYEQAQREFARHFRS